MRQDEALELRFAKLTGPPRIFRTFKQLVSQINKREREQDRVKQFGGRFECTVRLVASFSSYSTRLEWRKFALSMRPCGEVNINTKTGQVWRVYECEVYLQ